MIKELFEAKINDFLRQTKEEGSIKYSSEHRAFKKLINDSKINPEELNRVKSISLCFNLH
jgi:hypothetical protein